MSAPEQEAGCPRCGTDDPRCKWSNGAPGPHRTDHQAAPHYQRCPHPFHDAPSPHEGEAARCPTCGSRDREVSFFQRRDRSKSGPCPDPFHDPAPTEPRSISEEQLERVRGLAVRGGGVADGPNADALLALLAAYEQAEARAEEAELLDLDLARWQDRALRAEAERDTAQASEARLREALEPVLTLADNEMHLAKINMEQFHDKSLELLPARARYRIIKEIRDALEDALA